jgi:hypothetical protein
MEGRKDWLTRFGWHLHWQETGGTHSADHGILLSLRKSASRLGIHQATTLSWNLFGGRLKRSRSCRHYKDGGFTYDFNPQAEDGNTVYRDFNRPDGVSDGMRRF